MGIRIKAQSDENNEYAKAVHELCGDIYQRGIRPYLYPEIIFNLTSYGRRSNANLRLVHGLTRKVIKEKKEEMLASREKGFETATPPPEERKMRKVFLELLLELHLNDPSFTEEDIREEVDTFMFEGHDTTAMGISWTLYCLGLYPEIQKIAFREIEDIFQNDTDRDVTREDLTQMKYLECVIKGTHLLWISSPTRRNSLHLSFTLSSSMESIRLYPVVPLMFRKCTETFKFLGVSNPEKFDPERFLPENIRTRHPFAFIPFSAGPRNCIGQKFAMMEIKTVVANILRKFQLVSLDPRDKLNIYPALVTRTVKPLRMRFEPR
ncbi:cytochrome P450 4C1 [Caerostris extrusa]|uniref:Cytochrome P450 4C1 n=1 Tax=Caerostris extrusa TaxID=172846 RepID=A0AAV4VSD4_CAEEX|nr:cytochrome P450 4C1 [Caerostris extrusa]